MEAQIACSACGALCPEFAPRCACCEAFLPTISVGSASSSADPPGDPSLVGQDVAHYHLEEQIGSGAMGIVYRAMDARLLRPVALKVLSERLAPNDRARARMLREARATARLKSRHVVQVLDHGVWQGRPYIAMEYLEGRTLRERLDEAGRLSPDETARWIGEIAQGLGKAHAAGIVHRDLKPENVFLARDEDGEVAKILDFGVAKATHAWADVGATHAGTLLGTPAYMSPEQANGGRALDHRSDLWSLAVIAFECLTGRRPFHREELGALCVQILSEPLPVPSSIVPGLGASFDAWWHRAASRDPADRFQSAAELTEALAGALAESDVPAADPSPAASGAATISGERLPDTDDDESFMSASRSSVLPTPHRPPRLKRYAALAAAATLAVTGALLAVASLRATGAPSGDSTPASVPVQDSPSPQALSETATLPARPAPPAAPASAAPADSTVPVGSAPVGSAPVGSAPVGSAPVGSAPVAPAPSAAPSAEVAAPARPSSRAAATYAGPTSTTPTVATGAPPAAATGAPSPSAKAQPPPFDRASGDSPELDPAFWNRRN